MRELERPVFAQNWPTEPSLEELVLAFAAGNYARVKKEAPARAREAQERGEPELAAHFRELGERVSPEPLARALFLAAFLLIAALAWAAYGGDIHR